MNLRKNCDSERKITAEDCETDRLLKVMAGVNEKKMINKFR